MKKLLPLAMCLFSVQALQAQDRVGDFSLLDKDGVYFQLSRHGNRQAVVLLSEGAGCSSFTGSVAEFESIDSKYTDGADGFEFLLINATGEHNRAALRSQSEAYDTLPLLMDETQLVSEMLGFSTVGEAVVLDPPEPGDSVPWFCLESRPCPWRDRVGERRFRSEHREHRLQPDFRRSRSTCRQPRFLQSGHRATAHGELRPLSPRRGYRSFPHGQPSDDSGLGTVDAECGLDQTHASGSDRSSYR